MTTLAFFSVPVALLGALTPGPPSGNGLHRQKRLMRALTLFAGLAGLGWLDAFHSIVAAILLLVVEVGVRLAPEPVTASRPRRPTVDRPAKQPEYLQTQRDGHSPHCLFRGLLQGLTLLGLLALISYAVSLTPGFAAMVLDRDRTQLETKLAALEEAGDWPAAAALISHRLQRRASREWRDLLYQQLYDSLISAGAAAKREEAEPFFQRALQIARDRGLNPDLAAANLDRLNLRHAYDRQRQTALELAQKDLQRQAEIKQIGARTTDALRQNADLQAQISARRDEIQRLRQDLTKSQGEMAKAIADHAQATYTMLVQWADSLDPNNPLRKAKYEAARVLAEKHGFDSSDLTLHLAEWERALANARPLSLPSGVRATILRIDTNSTPPLTIMDLAVYMPRGHTMPGLALKDFRLRTGSRIENPLFVANLTPPSQSIQVVLLLDHSNSTAGPPMTAAESGAAELIRQVHGIASVKVLAFASRISTLTDWSDKSDTLSPSLPHLEPGGNTALQQAIDQAIQDLQSRCGPKAIVLFTDGRDTVGGPAISELTVRCRKHAITVHAVALETPELDKETLERLTQGTGGTLLPTTKAAELPQRFGEVALSLRQPFYRLIFAETSLAEHSEIIVGGSNAIRVVAKRQPAQP